MNETNDIVEKDDQKINGASPFWINDWYIDPDTCRIKRGDEVVKLEPKVMTVLACLAGEAGKVISREQLEAKVWPDMVVGYDSLASTIIKLIPEATIAGIETRAGPDRPRCESPRPRRHP